MTIINISRQPYSSGDEICQEVVRQLDFKLVDKSEINNKIKDFHCNFSDELNDLADEKEPGFFKHFFKNPQVYNCLLQSILFEEASQNDVVIKGRGANYVLNKPYVLNVRIVAPFDTRCRTLSETEDIKLDAAGKILEKKDHERENFISYLFKKDASDASDYDLVFNHGKWSTNVIVSTIIEYAKKIRETHPLEETEKDLLKRCALEKRVEASIRKEISEHIHLRVECPVLGEIKLTGFATDEIERNNIYELAKKCHGVKAVDNDLDTVRMHKP